MARFFLVAAGSLLFCFIAVAGGTWSGVAHRLLHVAPYAIGCCGLLFVWQQFSRQYLNHDHDDDPPR